MNIQKRKISQLKYADYNPRKKLKAGDVEYEKIKRSIEHFGYVDPIIINADNTVVGGHQRLTVLKDLGYSEIDVVVVNLSKDDEKSLNVALNKISGDWDTELLKNLLEELSEMQVDVELTGFEHDEIDALFLEALEPPEKFKEYDEELETKHTCPKCGYEWS